MSELHAEPIYPAEIELPDGSVWVTALLKIQTRDEHGRPEDLTFLPPERPVELTGGEVFIVAYVPKSVVEKTRT